MGLNHVVEVLTGADTEKVRRWQHERLSVYGIGKEYGRAEWAAIGRELVRLGFLQQTSGQMSVLELKREGAVWLNERRSVTLTKPVVKPDKILKEKFVGEMACDEALFEVLRKLRRTLADERNVSPYIIFSDVALREMSARLPANEAEFLAVSGVGEKKLKEFGPFFLAEISAYQNIKKDGDPF